MVNLRIDEIIKISGGSSCSADALLYSTIAVFLGGVAGLGVGIWGAVDDVLPATVTGFVAAGVCFPIACVLGFNVIFTVRH